MFCFLQFHHSATRCCDVNAYHFHLTCSNFAICQFACSYFQVTLNQANANTYTITNEIYRYIYLFTTHTQRLPVIWLSVKSNWLFDLCVFLWWYPFASSDIIVDWWVFLVWMRLSFFVRFVFLSTLYFCLLFFLCVSLFEHQYYDIILKLVVVILPLPFGYVLVIVDFVIVFFIIIKLLKRSKKFKLTLWNA